MKDQRWPGDYETISQEFAHSRMQEQLGLDAVMISHRHDYLALGHGMLDRYQTDELAPSWSTQLDTVGMQPHAREYLEREMSCMRSERKYEMIAGEVIDYPEGIQFSGRP